MTNCVYLLQREDGLIKIGYTSDFWRRFDVLRLEHGELRALALVEGGPGVEFWLHRKWAHLRVRGEWFKPDPELLRKAKEGTLVERPGGLCKFGEWGSPAGPRPEPCAHEWEDDEPGTLLCAKCLEVRVYDEEAA
jgi:Meiotically Up-regulated Gene 113 (MUG113) protein